MKRKIQAEEWITQAEAARIRGVSQAAIFGLVQRGRLKKTLTIGGKTFVDRGEVEALVSLPVGRPRKKTAGAASSKPNGEKKN